MGIFFSRGGSTGDGHGFLHNASHRLISKSETGEKSVTAHKKLDQTFKLKLNKRDGSYTIKVSRLTFVSPSNVLGTEDVVR